MRRLVALLLVSMLSLSVSAAGQGGVNDSTSLEGTGIAAAQYDDMAYGGTDYSMSINLDEGSDVTSVVWITQICINSGVCFAPEYNEMSSSDGIFYESQVDVDRTATYINWKFVLTHEDESTSDVPGGITALGVDQILSVRKKRVGYQASQVLLLQRQ